VKGEAQQTCKECVDSGVHGTGKATENFTMVYWQKCGMGLCLEECDLVK